MEAPSTVFAKVANLRRDTISAGLMLAACLAACSAGVAAALTALYHPTSTWPNSWPGDVLPVNVMLGLVVAVCAYPLLLSGVRGFGVWAREIAFRRVAAELQVAPLGQMSAAELNAILDYGRSPQSGCAASRMLQEHLESHERKKLQDVLRARMLKVQRDAEIAYLAARYSTYTGRMSELSAALDLPEAELSRLEVLARHLAFGLEQGPAGTGDGTLTRIGRLRREQQEPRIVAALLTLSMAKRLLMRRLFEASLEGGNATAEVLGKVWDDVEQMTDEQTDTARALSSGWRSGPLALTQAARHL
jgi:hypothetical protein